MREGIDEEDEGPVQGECVGQSRMRLTLPGDGLDLTGRGVFNCLDMAIARTRASVVEWTPRLTLVDMVLIPLWLGSMLAVCMSLIVVIARLIVGGSAQEPLGFSVIPEPLLIWIGSACALWAAYVLYFLAERIRGSSFAVGLYTAAIGLFFEVLWLQLIVFGAV